MTIRRNTQNFVFLTFLLLAGGCATSFAPPAETSTSLTNGPRPDADIEARQLRVQQLFIRGITRALLGDHQQAIFLFEQAVQIDDAQPAILDALAESHAAVDDINAGVFYSKQAHRMAPTNRSYLIRYAELTMRQGNPELALAALEEWLTVYPGDIEARFVAGEVLTGLGHEQAAMAHYREILNHGDDLQVRYRLLQLHNSLGNTHAMLETVEAMLKLDPVNTRLLHILAEVQVELGNDEDAIAALETALQADPTDIEAATTLGALYRKNGRSADADRVSASTNYYPTGSAGHQLAAATALYAESNRDENAARQAESLLNDLAARPSPPPEALFMLGELQYRNADFVAAASTLERALATDPRHADVWARAASSHFQGGQFDQALSAATEGLLLFPGQIPILRVAARASLELLMFERAVAYADEARDLLTDGTAVDEIRVELDIIGADAYERLGDHYATEGDIDNAVKAWTEALLLVPDRASLRVKLEPNP